MKQFEVGSSRLAPFEARKADMTHKGTGFDLSYLPMTIKSMSLVAFSCARATDPYTNEQSILSPKRATAV